MQRQSKSVLISAAKRPNGDYEAEEVIKDIDDFFATFEYCDVFDHENQIWEYPSGKIFDMSPNQAVAEKHANSTPGSGLWKPVLHQVAVEKDKVNNAYAKLQKSKHQLTHAAILTELDWIETNLREGLSRLTNEEWAENFTLNRVDGLAAEIGLKNAKQIKIEATGSTEVFFFTFDQAYVTTRIAYDHQTKLEVLTEFFEHIRAVSEGKYKETVLTKSASSYQWKLTIFSPSGDVEIKALGKLNSIIKRLTGYKPKINNTRM